MYIANKSSIIIILLVIALPLAAEIVEVETQIYSNDPWEVSVNEWALDHFTAFKDIEDGYLYINFTYYDDNTDDPEIVDLMGIDFRITIYDANGTYLTHFVTANDIAEACTYDYAFNYELSYRVSIRDLRDAEIIGLSIQNH